MLGKNEKNAGTPHFKNFILQQENFGGTTYFFTPTTTNSTVADGQPSIPQKDDRVYVVNFFAQFQVIQSWQYNLECIPDIFILIRLSKVCREVLLVYDYKRNKGGRHVKFNRTKQK